MIYLVSDKVSSFGWLNYSDNNVLDADDFYQGYRVGNSGAVVQFQLSAKCSVKKLNARHVIYSVAGPILVSGAFREIIERHASDGVEFLPVAIEADSPGISEFWALNPLRIEECVDMDRSEFRQTNFDMSNPCYSFDYMVMRDAWEYDAQIVICAEARNRWVVSQSIAEACVQANLKGLVFYSALDMTYGDRTVSLTL